ncbi:partial Carbamoyltransferase HypF, partial [Patescibacteria group bacterium]
LGLCHVNEFEGQAAMALESSVCTAYPMLNEKIGNLCFDWQPLLQKLCTASHTAEDIATELHHSLIVWLFAVAEKSGVQKIVLSGGCFQNAYLVETIMKQPTAMNYQIYRHANIPPNDGGLALGQIYARLLEEL